MSWWVELSSPEGGLVDVGNFVEGGTYALEGSKEASLNVTYNYSQVTCLIDFNFRTSLDGKVAGNTIEELERVVAKLGTTQFSDYWAPTPGNAGHAANILLEWAKSYPEGIWSVA